VPDDRRTSVAVYVCTYDRNDSLRVVLRGLAVAAARVAARADVGVVVVDDNVDGRARVVLDELGGRFPLGIHYRHSGERNISISRNLGLDAASGIGEWVAMTDDDCEPDPEWLAELLAVQERTGADAVTGPMLVDYPPGSPSWLIEQPFASVSELHADGAGIDVAQTNNSMISAAWLRAHPHLRFEPSFGRVGGEDMVFYRRAVAEGLRIAFAARAVVHAHEGPERATFRHQLRTQFWLGNTEYVTNAQTGGGARGRLLVRGLRRLLAALARPFVRLTRREPPQWRWCLAAVLRAAGLIVGVCGVRVRHH
jgi:succinoglycan biosynthesis protein ExoM